MSLSIYKFSAQYITRGKFARMVSGVSPKPKGLGFKKEKAL